MIKSTVKFFFLLSIFFAPFSSVQAETPLEDVELKLTIETQDLAYDFDDQNETVEKERIVIYSLEVQNKGGKTLENMTVFMNSPDYMVYESGTTRLQKNNEGEWFLIEDLDGYSNLVMGYQILSLSAGESFKFNLKYKTTVPEEVLDDPLYTLAFASLIDLYSDLPVMSEVIQNIISGDPLGSLSLQIIPNPAEGKSVFSGSEIGYLYRLTNAGGLTIKDITLFNFLPDGTICLENCGMLKIKEDLNPGQDINFLMRVKVKEVLPDLKEILHIGYDVSTSTLKHTEVRKDLKHPLNHEMKVGTNEFNLYAEQIPNFILNSSNGKPRPDQADVTETQYTVQYTGKGRPNTFNFSSGYGIQDTGNNIYKGYCSDHQYSHGKNSSVYAYNSQGGGCEMFSSCLLTSKPIDFLVTTTSPASRPKLIFENQSHLKSQSFSYGDTASVNIFMQNGGIFKPPEKFTLSRALEDGSMGEFQSTIQSQNLTEDLWVYSPAGYSKAYDSCSCGEDCTHTDKYPVYTWQKKSSVSISLQDSDPSHISVYSSTAWLKTEGGHIATNGSIINYETQANRLNLPFSSDHYMLKNEYVHDPETLLSPTQIYTPFQQKNSDYMIFSQHENQSFSSVSGDHWQLQGTEFEFASQGEAYERENNPRDYKDDLLIKEKFGPVLKDQWPKTIEGKIDIGNHVVWHQTEDLILGKEGVEDEVYFTGGQARLYVEGDVYIHANLFYDLASSQTYESLPFLRIDARNIYISDEVQDLEGLFLAREGFYSGKSHSQLRILGDVIAQKVHWQRKPLLQSSPEVINQPSEHLIEDLRKYILPVPGDTQLPDEYDVWRQVNPGTGQFFDAY